MSEVTILVADDHSLFLEGLCTLLTLKNPDLTIVGTATNGKEAVEKFKSLLPDIVLMDIRMPVMDGVEATRILTKSYPNAKIIMLTTFDDRELISEALRAGAHGYILKDSPADQVIQAILVVAAGNVMFSMQAATNLIDSIRAHQGTDPTVAKTVGNGLLERMTAREREILFHIAIGKDNAEIGEQLCISEKTVRNYVSRIYDILGLHSRTQTVVWARENLMVFGPEERRHPE